MSINLSSGIGNNYSVGVPVAQQPQAPIKPAQNTTQAPQTTLNTVDSNKIDNKNVKSASYDPASFKMPDQNEAPKKPNNQTEAEPTHANGLVAAFAAFASMASGSYVPELGNAIQKTTSDYLSLTNRFGGSVGMNPFGGIKEPSNKKSDYETFIENNKALNEAEKVKN